MKNKKRIIQVILMLFCLTSIISCSSESTPTINNTTTEGNILRSYVSGDGFAKLEHVFGNNGTRYDKILYNNSTRYMQFVYNSNNKMTQILLGPDTSPFPSKTNFYYDNSGKIIKMELDNRYPGSTGTLKTYLFTYNINEIIQELVSDEDPNYNHIRIRYKFNNDGLLIAKHEYSDSPNNTYVFTQYYQSFLYDNNKNIISIKATPNSTHDLPDSPVSNPQTRTTTYEYDNKVNPMHTIFMNHYLNYILSNNLACGIVQGNVQDRVLSIGTNNLTKSIFPSDPQLGTPIDNEYKNVFTYQQNNLPIKLSRVSMVDNREVSSITINYGN